MKLDWFEIEIEWLTASPVRPQSWTENASSLVIRCPNFLNICSAKCQVVLNTFDSKLIHEWFPKPFMWFTCTNVFVVWYSARKSAIVASMTFRFHGVIVKRHVLDFGNGPGQISTILWPQWRQIKIKMLRIPRVLTNSIDMILYYRSVKAITTTPAYPTWTSLFHSALWS